MEISSCGDCRFRVLKGGIWDDHPRWLRTDIGDEGKTNLWTDTTGFRCARVLSPCVQSR